MPTLLVDDRDGKIIAELSSQDEVQQILEAWASDDGSIPEYLCIIDLNSRQGAIIGTDTSVKIRPLS